MSQIIREKQDLTYLSWSLSRRSSGTAGSFLKAYSELGGKKTFYKLSNYDWERGVRGHECVNEIIVDRLLDRLGFPHLHYQLIHADILVGGRKQEVYLCASGDFKRQGETKLALDAYWEAEHLAGEEPLAFCLRNGWGGYIYQMLVTDFLILNRDRHGANIEVLRDSRAKTLRLAPLFDHGLSLLCRCERDEEARAFDVMEDRRVNNYIGSRSTWENLRLIPRAELPPLRPLKEGDRAVLLAGLDGILSPIFQAKIWELLWRRWQAYEAFCRQG